MSGIMRVGTQETEEMKDDRVEGEHDNSRTRDVTRAWPIAGTQRGKSDRPRHLHLGPARAAAASRCTFPRTAVAKHDQGGPTFLQTTLQYSYKAKTGRFNHISNTERVAMGALLSLPLLAVPSVGSVRLSPIVNSCATLKADMVYSS